MLEQLGDLVGRPGFTARRTARRLDQAVDELLDLALGHRAHEAVDRPAAEEGIDRRDRLNAQLLGQHLVLVDVDLDELDRAIGGLDHFLDGRLELLAGPAPRRPEIDDHRHRARRFEHVLGELGLVAVLDEVGGGGLRRGALQHRFHGSSNGEFPALSAMWPPPPGDARGWQSGRSSGSRRLSGEPRDSRPDPRMSRPRGPSRD